MEKGALTFCAQGCCILPCLLLLPCATSPIVLMQVFVWLHHGPGPGRQHGEEKCSAESERLVKLAQLWQAEEVEEWHMVAGEGITATTAVPLHSILANPPEATRIWYPRQGGKGAQKDSRLNRTHHNCLINALVSGDQERKKGKERNHPFEIRLSMVDVRNNPSRVWLDLAKKQKEIAETSVAIASS